MPTPRVCKAHNRVKALLDACNDAYNCPMQDTLEDTLRFAAESEKAVKSAKKLAGAFKEWAQALRAQERAARK